MFGVLRSAARAGIWLAAGSLLVVLRSAVRAAFCRSCCVTMPTLYERSTLAADLPPMSALRVQHVPWKMDLRGGCRIQEI